MLNRSSQLMSRKQNECFEACISMRRTFTDGTPNLTLIWVWLSRKSAMRGRRRLYSAFLLSTVFLLLLSWVNKHRLLPGNQVRDLVDLYAQ